METEQSTELELLKQVQTINGEIVIVRASFFDRRFFTISDGLQQISLDSKHFENISDIDQVTLVLNLIKKRGYNLVGTTQTSQSTTEYTFQKV